MATTVLLARHGETDWNRERRWQGHADTPLNERGRDQARALAALVRDDPPQPLYASDLRRARETAEILAAGLELPVLLDRRLREVDVGEWSGLTTAEVELRYPDGVERRRSGATGWESGESFDAMSARILAVLAELSLAHAGERVVVVSHGGPMRAVWSAAGAAGDQAPSYGNCAVVEIGMRSGRVRRIHSWEGGGLHQQVQG